MESKDAINWINDWTSLKATKLKEYNANEIFMAANFFSNKLVYYCCPVKNDKIIYSLQI